MTWGVIAGTGGVEERWTYVGLVAVEGGDGELEGRHAMAWRCSRRRRTKC